MDRQKQTELLDSLTKEQRKAIAELILGTEPDGDYQHRGDDSDSFWQEDVKMTLVSLARVFSTYDPEMAID
jgi:hypothetical protein